MKNACQQKKNQGGIDPAPVKALRWTEKHSFSLQNHGQSRPAFIKTVVINFKTEMMKYTLLYFLCGFGIFSAQNVQGQNLNKDFLESKIDSLVTTEINDTTPGVVIGIVQKGELIFSKGHGLANLSYGIPNDSKKVFNLGSTSKQFLGYAFAMLHVKGA